MTDQYKGLENEWHQVSQAIDQSDFRVFPVPIVSENRSVYWPSDRGFRQFLELARSLDKKILYAGKRTFEVTDIEDLLATFSIKATILWPDDENDSDVLEPSIFPERDDYEIVDFIHDATLYVGRPFQYSVEWVHDGIVHSHWRLADWYSHLMDEVANLGSIIEQRVLEEAKNKEEEMEVIARQVAKDCDFQSRPNKQLRVKLIKVSFPALKPHEAYHIERSAWSIYREEILPEREKAIVEKADSLLKSGDSLNDIAHKLGMTRGKLQRLIGKYKTSE